MLGQPVLRQTLRAHQGQLRTLLDLSALPTGVYTLRLHAQEGTVVKRLVKE